MFACRRLFRWQLNGHSGEKTLKISSLAVCVSVCECVSYVGWAIVKLTTSIDLACSIFFFQFRFVFLLLLLHSGWFLFGFGMWLKKIYTKKKRFKYAWINRKTVTFNRIWFVLFFSRFYSLDTKAMRQLFDDISLLAIFGSTSSKKHTYTFFMINFLYLNISWR